MGVGGLRVGGRVSHWAGTGAGRDAGTLYTGQEGPALVPVGHQGGPAAGAVVLGSIPQGDKRKYSHPAIYVYTFLCIDVLLP